MENAPVKQKNEHLEQKEFMITFRKKYPGVFVFAIPNGGRDSYATINYFYEEGLYPGIPDLNIPQWDLWVEMKTMKGLLRDNQQACIKELLAIGQNVIVGYTCTNALEKIELFLDSGIKSGYGDIEKPKVARTCKILKLR